MAFQKLERVPSELPDEYGEKSNRKWEAIGAFNE
jgi:hypothetical protein